MIDRPDLPPDADMEQVTQLLHRPDVPEVIATTEDARRGPSVAKRFRHFVQQVLKQGLWLTVVESVEQVARLITGAPTLRFSRVTPQLHVGGQHLPHGWPILKRRGITAVVSLRGEYDDYAAGIAPSRYLYLPTVDNHAPPLAYLVQGATFIREEVERGGRVYIHCWEGVGRAPTMAAAYLVSIGFTPAQAWQLIRTARPFIRPTLAQIEQVERFAAVWNNDTAGKM
ncbi:MAG: dual specificity protein phosphatase family protein [Chloroflexi bacterium]|nr:dual specificity protein phosphatase family protein [Chloroflexota bacterium]